MDTLESELTGQLALRELSEREQLLKRAESRWPEMNDVVPATLCGLGFACLAYVAKNDLVRIGWIGLCMFFVIGIHIRTLHRRIDAAIRLITYSKN